MFNEATKAQLTGLLAARIVIHSGWVQQAHQEGDPTKFAFVLDQAASASAEVTTIARMIGVYDEFNAALTAIGIGPLPDLSEDDKTADEQASGAVDVIRSKATLTTHLN